MMLPARLRRGWLRWMLIGTSLIGIPLSYLTGHAISGREASYLENARFRVAPEEVTSFERLAVIGRINVEVACAEQLKIEVADHEDEVYIFQRREDRLRIAAQQRNSSEHFFVRIHTPNPFVYIDLQRGAKLVLPACAAPRNQLTALMTAGSVLEASGETNVLNLFGSTGSKFLDGPDGPMVMREAIVDMVLGATAELCAVQWRVTGSASVKGFIYVRPDQNVVGPREGLVIRDCDPLPSE